MPSAPEFVELASDVTLTAVDDTALADNGGPTETHALLPGSVAIDAAGGCGLATDQRGVPRDDGSCDSGSYEHSPPIPISSTWSLAVLGAGLLAVLIVFVTRKREAQDEPIT